MFIKYVLPVLAILGLAFGIWSVLEGKKVPPPSRPVVEPPTRKPFFKHQIAGAGLMEAKSESIPMGSSGPGVVFKVHVVVGQRVKAGAPLFTLDDREKRAELEVRRAALEAARANHERIEAAPQVGDIPTAEAAV